MRPIIVILGKEEKAPFLKRRIPLPFDVVPSGKTNNG